MLGKLIVPIFVFYRERERKRETEEDRDTQREGYRYLVFRKVPNFSFNIIVKLHDLKMMLAAPLKVVLVSLSLNLNIFHTFF